MEPAEQDRKALESWLAGAGFELRDRRPLPGDVSQRRYERLTARGGATAILALYPAELREVCGRFARSTRILAAAGIPVPRVLAADCDRGWMLLQDLGELTLADLRDRPWSELAAYFEDAAALAARVAPPPALGERRAAAALPGPAGRVSYPGASAQRTPKAVGPYAPFAPRGSGRPLPLIAPTLRRFLHHFARVPEGAELVPGLELAWRE